VPSVAAQLQFNEIAQTDLENHLRYLDSVRIITRKFARRFTARLSCDESRRIRFENRPRHAVSKRDRTNPFSGVFFCDFGGGDSFIGSGWMNLQKEFRILRSFITNSD
jgi:hypothetical protein